MDVFGSDAVTKLYSAYRFFLIWLFCGEFSAIRRCIGRLYGVMLL